MNLRVCNQGETNTKLLRNIKVNHRRLNNDKVRGELMLSDLGLAWAAAAANHVQSISPYLISTLACKQKLLLEQNVRATTNLGPIHLIHSHGILLHPQTNTRALSNLSFVFECHYDGAVEHSLMFGQLCCMLVLVLSS